MKNMKMLKDKIQFYDKLRDMEINYKTLIKEKELKEMLKKKRRK